MGDIYAIYCRVSTNLQSTDRQKEDLLALANEKKWNITDDRIYIDIISGFQEGENRPMFSQMLDDIKPKGITHILFSELSRLARNATELLKKIDDFRQKGITLYFEKQNLWVGDKNFSLGSEILLHVLAIMSKYEIDLFAERCLSGKVSKLHSGGGGGHEYAFGYKSDDTKNIIIEDEEAKIVREIFNDYVKGKSSVQICEKLNAKKIPTAYQIKLKRSSSKRKSKGLQEKEYTKFDLDKLKWRESTINRMLHNSLYIGRKHVVLHKPDPANPLPKNKRTNREIAYEYDEYDENLRIISDEIWEAAQEKLLKANYNKNNAIKRENLLKPILKCGECGSNFTVEGSAVNSKYVIDINKYDRKYACYGLKKNSHKKKICFHGGEIAMRKLDGLVLQFSLKMFAQKNINETNSLLLDKIEDDIKTKNEEVGYVEKQLKRTEQEYINFLRRALLLESDIMSENLIQEEQKKFTEQIKLLNSKFENLKGKISILKNNKTKIMNFNKNSNLYENMHKVRTDRNLVKTMVDDFLETITIFRIHKLWFLIIINYKNGIELWGKVKSARYKNDEMFYDYLLCKYGIELQTWIIDNTDHSFSYDKERKIITYNGKSELYKDLPKGEYDYDSMNNYLTNSQNIGSFPLYIYEELPHKQ